MFGTSAEHDYKSEKQQAHNSDNLDTSKDKLGLSINRDSEDVETDDEYYEECNPDGRIDC